MQKVILGIIAGLCAVAASSQAQAVTVTRQRLLQPVSVCQGALPSFEGAFRKRPIAIKNEGTSTAFLTCSTFGDNGGPQIFSIAAPYFHNANASGSVTVNCSLSEGFLDDGTPTLIPRSVTLAAGAAGLIVWTTSDFGGNKFRTANVSCAIPAGVEMGWFAVFYDEDVGA